MTVRRRKPTFAAESAAVDVQHPRVVGVVRAAQPDRQRHLVRQRGTRLADHVEKLCTGDEMSAGGVDPFEQGGKHPLGTTRR